MIIVYFQKLDSIPFIHQGTDRWLRFMSKDVLLPIWMAGIIIFICLCFSALFSGLNLGLMSLDRTELKVSNTFEIEIQTNAK